MNPFDLVNMSFQYKWVLWLIPLLWLLSVMWHLSKRQKRPHLKVSTLAGVEGRYSVRARFFFLLPLLRTLALSLLLVAIARPQEVNTDEKVSSYGIDIVFAFDISSSMLAQDFSPNRLEVAKEVAIEFIDGRPSDRFGLIVFSGESYPQVPITTDHKIVIDQILKTQNGLLTDGTAIGMGIGSGVNRLVASDATSKVLILMTDGVNNAGKIDPITATEAAIQYGVKIYTIGIGSKGTAYMPAYKNANGTLQYDYLPVEIDEELLQEVADMTGGKYFRAQNEEALSLIYEEIDQLEKTEIETSQTVNITERYFPFAFLAMFLLSLEVLLRLSVFRSYP